MADIRTTTTRGPVASSSGMDLLESDHSSLHPLVSWRSILGGLVVSMLTLGILLSLGMAFGGIGLNDGASAQNAGIFTGVWFLVSAVLALFAGSYFAARISKFHTNRIGSAQGLVIAALFFGFILYQTFSAIGWAGRTAGSAVSSTAQAIGQGAAQAAQSAPSIMDNPTVSRLIDQAIGELNLKSDPQTVASGVATRLIQGNTEGAANYLSSQAGISRAEASRRLEAIRGQIDQAVVQAREAAAKALQATGWSLFATLLLGTAAAIGGGALGSRANLRKPLTREQYVSTVGLEPSRV